jgi:cobalt-zinc-cadmium efflux system outer membrane protein
MRFSGQNTTRITLDQAIDLALAHNHSLQATRTLILQNQAQEITANLRPNPTLGVDTQFIPFFSPQDFSGDNSACAFLAKFSPLRSLK